MEEEPDVFAFDLLFTLGLMSYADAQPVGVSHHHYNSKDEWSIEKFLSCLKFSMGTLVFSRDYMDAEMQTQEIMPRASGGQSIGEMGVATGGLQMAQGHIRASIGQDEMIPGIPPVVLFLMIVFDGGVIVRG